MTDDAPKALAALHTAWRTRAKELIVAGRHHEAAELRWSCHQLWEAMHARHRRLSALDPWPQLGHIHREDI